MSLDLSPLYGLLGDPNNLIIIFLIAVGYVVKTMPWVENRWIKTVVVTCGLIATPFFIEPLARGLVLGVVYAAVSMLLYDFVISKIEAFLLTKFGGSPPPYLQVLAISFLFIGCASLTPNFSSLPYTASASEKADALRKDSILKLKDPAFQKGMHDALVFAGKIALRQALSDSDRQNISDQLYSWGSSFDSLATGQAVTPDDLAKTAKTFNTSFDVQKNGQFIDAANGVWLVIFPLLQQANDSDLIRQWLIVLASAARDAAS